MSSESTRIRSFLPPIEVSRTSVATPPTVVNQNAYSGGIDGRSSARWPEPWIGQGKREQRRRNSAE